MYDYSAARKGDGLAGPPPVQPPTHFTTSSSLAAQADMPAVLAAYKEEVEKLKDALQLVSKEKGSSGVLEGKYLAQLKKCRTLTVELESEKARNKQLMTEVEEARLGQKQQQQSNNANKEKRNKAGSSNAGLASSAAGELGGGDGEEGGGGTHAAAVKEAKERAARAYQQLRERDLQLEEIKRENGQLRQMFSREVGKTPAEVEQLLQSGGDTSRPQGAEDTDTPAAAAAGWRGRAEHIALLRTKVKDLERSLATSRAVQQETQLHLEAHLQQQQQQQQRAVGSVIDGGGDDVASLMQIARQSEQGTLVGINRVVAAGGAGRGSGVSVGGVSAATGITMATTTRRDVDDDARQRVSDMASKRLGTLRDVQAALEEKTAEVKEERQKQAALQARFSNLQASNSQLKTYIATILEKSATDDELISAYKAEVEESRKTTYLLKQEIADAQEQLWGGENSSSSAGQRNNKGTLSDGVAAAAVASNNRSTDVGTEGDTLRLARENAAMRQRISTLEAQLMDTEREQARRSSIVVATDGAPASSPVTTSSDYDSALANWVIEALRDPASTIAAGTATADEAEVLAAVGGALRCAHAHLVAVEEAWSMRHTNTGSSSGGTGKLYEQYKGILTRSQRCLSAVSTGGGGAEGEALASAVKALATLPPLESFLLRENSDLKQRVKSLTEVLKRESQAHALILRQQKGSNRNYSAEAPAEVPELSVSAAAVDVKATTEYMKLKRQYEDLRKAFNGLQLQLMGKQ